MTKRAKPAWQERPERGSACLLKLMFRIATLVGRPVARVLLGPIALYFWLRTPLARADSARYLGRALGRPARARDTLRHYFVFASVILDRVYFLCGRTDGFEISIDGKERLLEALRPGRGVFLVGAHMGSFESLRTVGRAQPGLRVSMAMYEDNARKLGSLLRAIDPGLLDDVVALGRVDSMLRVSERLQRGDLVGFLADRSFGNDDTIEVDFLGTPAPFPTGVFRMAAVMRAPVFQMAGLYLGDSRYALRFEPLADFSDTARGARAAQVAQAVHRYASRLEAHCREAPYNWFNFFDFWARPAPLPAARSAVSAACALACAVALGASGLAALSGAPVLAAQPMAPAARPPGSWSLEHLLAMVSARDNSRRRFVERKFVAALDAPVDTRGELRFMAPSRLEKRTASPYAEILTLDGDQLGMEGPTGRRTLSLQQVPEAAALVEALRATLAGDRAVLERVFTVTLDGDAGNWRMRLVPRDPRALRLIHEIRVSGQGGELELIETDQADGDRSVLRILP